MRFIILLLFVPCWLGAQQSKADATQMLEALKKSGYVRQEGNHLIFKAKRASDTAQVRLMYGALFSNTNYTIGFEINGQYFDSRKNNSAVITDVKRKPADTVLTAAPVVKQVPKAMVLNAEQLYVSSGSFLIKTGRDYRYITLPRIQNGIIPKILSYTNNTEQNYWQFIPQPYGYYKIKTSGNLYLQEYNNGIYGYGVSCGSNNTAIPDRQLWKLSGGEKGLYKIVSKEGRYLSLTAATVTEDATISVDATASSVANAQYWHLIKMEGEPKVMTAFEPVQHGFKFANTFDNSRFIAGVRWAFGGRCAGMIYAALDYYFNRISIPAANQLPPEGSILSTYISARQEQSTNANIDRFTELNINPGGIRTNEFFNWGLQNTGGGRLQQIRAELDAGRPVSIILFNPRGDLIHYPHHCVAVLGYSLGRYRGDLGQYRSDVKLYVYDPNFPDEIKVMIPNLADDNNPRYAYVNASKAEADITEWLTYFPNAGYRAVTPVSNDAITGCPASPGIISRGNYSGVNRSNYNFKCITAVAANFYGSTCVQTDFERAILDSAIFHGANLRNSNFSSTSLARTNFFGADLKDTRFFFARGEFTKFEGADLKLAKFNSAQMINCNFIGADLFQAELTGGNFTGTHFTRASLSRTACENANFNNTELSLTNFQHAFLVGASFRNAIFERTDFRNADLRNADFTGAVFRGRLLLEGANLEGAIGLPR